MRLITGQEANLDHIRAMAQRGINYQDEEQLYDVPIIDAAYVFLSFQKAATAEPNQQRASSTTMGCLELCMYADGSRHQEEIIVTGTKGRLEAYLPENKVYAYTRPSLKEWSDRTVPPTSIQETVHDCSNVRQVHGIDAPMPTHGGYHYCSTAVEWYRLIDAIRVYDTTGEWKPQVSLQDGLKAVEIGLHATRAIVNEAGDVS
jgi:myo-inositol 2-dehydrogenase/D-chiro-inositol 1-dehydrogenase